MRACRMPPSSRGETKNWTELHQAGGREAPGPSRSISSSSATMGFPLPPEASPDMSDLHVDEMRLPRRDGEVAASPRRSASPRPSPPGFSRAAHEAPDRRRSAPPSASQRSPRAASPSPVPRAASPFSPRRSLSPRPASAASSTVHTSTVLYPRAAPTSEPTVPAGRSPRRVDYSPPRSAELELVEREVPTPRTVAGRARLGVQDDNYALALRERELRGVQEELVAARRESYVQRNALDAAAKRRESTAKVVASRRQYFRETAEVREEGASACGSPSSVPHPPPTSAPAPIPTHPFDSAPGGS